MTKWIFGCLIAVSAAFASNVFAADDSTEPMLSATELVDQINAMDAQTYEAYGPREFECKARNERGEHFRAVGRFPEQAQREAMNQCYKRHSRRCVEEGCRPR